MQINYIYIILIAAGFLLVIISFFLAEKKAEQKEITIPSLDEMRTVQMNEQMKLVLKEYTEQAVAEAKEQLDKLSNDKIISLHEFSEQVLQKIDHNHKEVIFLYNMLVEKEEAMKKELKSVEEERIKIQKQLMEYRSLEKHELAANNDIKQIASNFSKAAKAADSSPSMKKNNYYEKKQNRKTNRKEQVSPKPMSDSKQEILQLYKDGKTVMDIARILDMGQGEVKLIIDLFQGNKNKQD